VPCLQEKIRGPRPEFAVVLGFCPDGAEWLSFVNPPKRGRDVGLTKAPTLNATRDMPVELHGVASKSEGEMY
jgi:hypothetical protein